MADPDAANAAFSRAWSAYLLIRRGVEPNGERCVELERFIRARHEAGVEDAERLAVEGLKHLKKLDQSGEASTR